MISKLILIFVLDQPYSFDRNALLTIRNRRLSDIICDNTEIKEVPTNAFLSSNDPSNNLKRCNSNAVNHLEFKDINLIIVTHDGKQNDYYDNIYCYYIIIPVNYLL